MDMARKELYIKGDSIDIQPDYICLQKGQTVDFPHISICFLLRNGRPIHQFN